MKFPQLMIPAALLLFPAAPPVMAQTPPDAGQVLEESVRPLAPQAPSTGIRIEDPPEVETAPGGPRVVLREVALKGMSRFDEQTLLGALGEFSGKAYDLAGLQELADRITRHYRAAGYPFALAYLPPQNVTGGTLRIEIVEGRYGEVRVTGDKGWSERAQNFLAPLGPGEVIEAGPLSRALLILGDQPGVRVSPVLMPGEKVGTGDLEVTVAAGPKVSGELGLDNHGNRHTGAWRPNARVSVNRLLTFGDELVLGAMLTDEQLWYGRLDYSLPVGGSGLRAQAGFGRTHYELGGDFEPLDASGTADVAALGLHYPLLRTMTTNLGLQATYQYKDLEDKDATPTPDRTKSSHSLPVTLQFDHRDQLGGGGITWGLLGWTPGRLSLDHSLKETDRLAGETEGGFHKWSLEAGRLQRLPAYFTLFGRFSGQWADANLDSSEGFSLGGANGVRAYPQGEAFGDEGWLTQVELRYNAGDFTPYGFYDSGRIRYHASPWAEGENSRSLSGAGAGLRFDTERWSLDISAAWRVWGGEPRSDSRDDRPRVWMNARHRF